MASVTLYQGPVCWGLPNVSPFCIKVETYMRMTSVPYTTRVGDIRKAPKGKIPWIEHEGRVVSDSTHIIDYFKATFGDALDAELSASERARGHLLQRTLEESCYFVGVYGRWACDEAWPTTKAIFDGLIPRLVSPVIVPLIRRSVVKSLHGQGIGRHAPEQIWDHGKRDLDAIAEVIGDGPYVLGEQPTSYDAAAYGMLISVLWAPFDHPVKRHGQSLPNLEAYCQRIKAKYWG